MSIKATKAIKRLKAKLSDDKHLTELMRKAAIAFIGRVVGAGLMFALYLYLARILGAADYGIFMLAFTIITIASVLARLGLDNVLIKEIAATTEEGKFGEARGYLKAAMVMVVLTSMGFTLVLMTFSETIAQAVFNKPGLSEALYWMSLLVLPFSLTYLIGEALKGIKQVGKASLVQTILLPGLTIAILWIFSFAHQWQLSSTIQLYVVVGYLAMLIAWWLWQQVMPRVKALKSDLRRMMNTGIPLLWAASGALIMAWGDTIVLGIYETEEAVGAYSAASRTALLSSLVLVAVNGIAAPKFAAMYAKGDLAGLAKLAQQATIMMTILVLPPSLALLVWPEWVLGWFGEDFKAASVSLMILVAGQLVNVSCGSVGYLLSMTGHEKVVRNIMLSSSTLNVAMNIAMVQWLGMIGVAIATALSVAIWNVWMMILVRKKLGFWMITTDSFQT